MFNTKFYRNVLFLSGNIYGKKFYKNVQGRAVGYPVGYNLQIGPHDNNQPHQLPP